MAWDNTQPPNTQAVGYGALRIRELKTDLETLGDLEHFFTPADDGISDLLRHKPGSAKALYGTFLNLPATGSSPDFVADFLVGEDHARLYVVQEGPTFNSDNMGCLYFDDPALGWVMVGTKKSHKLEGYFAGTFTVANGSTTVTLTSTPLLDIVHDNNVAVDDLFAVVPAAPLTYADAIFYRVDSITDSTHFELERSYDEVGGSYSGRVFYTRPFYGFMSKTIISRNVLVDVGVLVDGVDISEHIHDGTAGNGLALTAATMTALPDASIPLIKLILTGTAAFASGSYAGGTNPQTITVGFAAKFILIGAATDETPGFWIDGYGTDLKRTSTGDLDHNALSVGVTSFNITTSHIYYNGAGKTYKWIALGTL